MPFTCPRCGMTSHHPKDEQHGYCGNCHDFTGITLLPCDVHLPPDTYLRRGVEIKTLLLALKVRQSKPAHEMVFGEETEGGLRNAQQDTHDLLDQLTATTQAELQLVFDLRQAADEMAIARWSAAHPESELVIPDHADLVIWLLDQLAVTSPCPQCKRTDGLHEAGCQYAVVAARLMRVDAALAKRVGKMIERDSTIRAALTHWLKSYPLDIFPEPDLKRAAIVLKDNGLTLDSLSASMARHVLGRVIDIFDDKDVTE